MTHKPRLTCPICGAEMNHHAMKVDHDFDDSADVDPTFEGILKEVHGCPHCGHIEMKPA